VGNFLDKLLGRGRPKPVVPKKPLEVGICNNWDFALRPTPYEGVSTNPPMQRILRTWCMVVGTELHVYYNGNVVVDKVPVSECTFYKDVIYE